MELNFTTVACLGLAAFVIHRILLLIDYHFPSPLARQPSIAETIDRLKISTPSELYLALDPPDGRRKIEIHDIAKAIQVVMLPERRTTAWNNARRCLGFNPDAKPGADFSYQETDATILRHQDVLFKTHELIHALGYREVMTPNHFAQHVHAMAPDIPSGYVDRVTFEQMLVTLEQLAVDAVMSSGGAMACRTFNSQRYNQRRQMAHPGTRWNEAEAEPSSRRVHRIKAKWESLPRKYDATKRRTEWNTRITQLKKINKVNKDAAKHYDEWRQRHSDKLRQRRETSAQQWMQNDRRRATGYENPAVSWEADGLRNLNRACQAARV